MTGSLGRLAVLPIILESLSVVSYTAADNLGD
jgi:hypothetical protein